MKDRSFHTFVNFSLLLLRIVGKVTSEICTVTSAAFKQDDESTDKLLTSNKFYILSDTGS